MRVRAVILVFFWFSQMGWCAEDSLRDAAQLLDAGRSREAEGMLHRLLDHDPQNGEARQLLGDLFRKDGKGPEAEREYRRALDLGRRDPELFKSLATVQKWQRHYSAALSSYREALRLAPLDSEARDELEDLQYRRGLSLFGAVGGSETDFTEKGWQTERPTNLSRETMDGFARELKLDLNKFKADMDSDACKQQLSSNQSLLGRVGVRGTPAFFINGRYLVGAVPIERFKQIIDEELKKADEAIKKGTKLQDYYASLVAQGKKSI